jgi:hypothetical protein
MRTTLAAAVLVGALIASGAILAHASGMSISDIIKTFEQDRRPTGVARFAQPRLIENYPTPQKTEVRWK